MKKLTAALPDKSNTRLGFPLNNITNQKPNPGRLLALEHNKALLASYKQKIVITDSKLVEAEQRAKLSLSSKLGICDEVGLGHSVQKSKTL